MYRFKKGSGFPVSVPSVDLVEIGAGGGSLARVDELGLLKVGPDRRAPSPGPACYGRGGTEPAVTDADVLLGFLDAALLPRRRHGARPRPPPNGHRRGRGDARRCPSPTRRPASTTWSTRTWPRVADARRRAGRRPAGRHAHRVRGRRPGARVRRSPSCSSRPRVIFPVNASVLSAFGTLVTPVRIDLARSTCAAARRGRRDRARRRCSTSCGPRARRVLAAAGRRPRPMFASATASTPATPARATRSPSGSARATTGPATPRACASSFDEEYRARLRPDDPRRRRRGRDVAAVGVRRSGDGGAQVDLSSQPSGRPGTARHRAGALPPRRSPLSTCPSTGATRSASAPVLAGPGDRRGARDHHRHPARVVGRRRRPTARSSPLAQEVRRDADVRRDRARGAVAVA